MKKLNLFFVVIINLYLWFKTPKGEKPRDFYYSEAEQISFFVTGYYSDYHVLERYKYFTQQAIRLLKHSGLSIWHLNRVKVGYVEYSNWCKYCYYVYIKDVPTAPAQAYTLKVENDWTMWSYLHKQ